MSAYTVGLDVHSKKSTYVIQNDSGQVVGKGEIPTTFEGLERFKLRHKLPEGTVVGLETGNVSFFVSRVLQALELKPIVIDAQEVRRKAHRPHIKSDTRDAYEICDGLRRDIYRSIVHVPPVEIAEVRELLSRRRHFVRVRTAEINAAKRFLRAIGLGRLVAHRTLRTESAWQKLLDLLVDESVAAHIKRHLLVWRTAHQQVKELELELNEQPSAIDKDVRRLQTIPGVGPIVALTAVSVFSDVSRFPDAKHASSYGGLAPKTNQSGDRNSEGGISKRGSAELRAMLCEAAQHARRPHHPLNPYFSKLSAKRGHRIAVVAVAHRLCRIMFAMLRDGAEFDVTKLNIERGPFTRKTTRLYRLKSSGT